MRQARAAADRGEHAAAILLFERARDRDPARAREILRELADQITYAGNPAEAVPLYRELLAMDGVPSAQREAARKNLAQALTWSGDVSQAVAAWTEILDANPGDPDARLGLSEALIAAARAAAGRSANAEAADLFGRARDIAPFEDAGLSREYADQLAFSGRAAEAVPIYRKGLAESPLAPEERRRAQRGLAFALLWLGDTAAIREMEAAYAAAPDDDEIRKGLADAVLAIARRAAGQNANALAAGYFARVLQVAPERRRAVLLEYADQLLYSGSYAQAGTFYREILAWPGLSTDAERAARLGLARSLAWSGDHAAAIPQYSLIIRDRIDDVDALIGRGESRNALFLHRDALSDFERALVYEPDREQAVRGAAQAELSLGYPRLALARVQPFVAAGNAHRDSLLVAANAQLAIGRSDLAEDVADELIARDSAGPASQEVYGRIFDLRRPRSTVEASYVSQSDGLDIATVRKTVDFSWNRGLTTISPFAEVTDYGGGDFPDVTVYGLGVRVLHRFNDEFDFVSAFWLDFEDEGALGDDVVPLYEASLNYTPDDFWRLSVTGARGVPDDSKSIVNDIRLNEFGLRAEYAPGYEYNINATGAVSDYSDGNFRWLGHASASARVVEGPDIWLGVRGTAFVFDKELDNGYWNPKSYGSLEATLHTYGRIRESLRYDFQSSIGYEWSDPDGDRPIWSVALLLGFDVNAALAFEAFARYQQSGEGGGGSDDRSDGFSQATFGGKLFVRW